MLYRMFHYWFHRRPSLQMPIALIYMRCWLVRYLQHAYRSSSGSSSSSQDSCVSVWSLLLLFLLPALRGRWQFAKQVMSIHVTWAKLKSLSILFIRRLTSSRYSTVSHIVFVHGRPHTKQPAVQSHSAVVSKRRNSNRTVPTFKGENAQITYL